MRKRIDRMTEQEKAEWWVELADQNYRIKLKNERFDKWVGRIPFFLIGASLIYLILKN